MRRRLSIEGELWCAFVEKGRKPIVVTVGESPREKFKYIITYYQSERGTPPFAFTKINKFTKEREYHHMFPSVAAVKRKILKYHSWDVKWERINRNNFITLEEYRLLEDTTTLGRLNVGEKFMFPHEKIKREVVEKGRTSVYAPPVAGYYDEAERHVFHIGSIVIKC